MSNPTPLILIAVTIGLSLLTTNNTVNSSMAASKGNGGASAGSIIQELVNTGNPTLDKEINKFYSCISKTHQDPPSIRIVDNCYYQTSIGGDSKHVRQGFRVHLLVFWWMSPGAYAIIVSGKAQLSLPHSMNNIFVYRVN